jgi:hypothetical protein
MSLRKAIVIAVALLAVICAAWWLQDERHSQARREALTRLWVRPGCDQLALIALEARRPITRPDPSGREAAFPQWDNWPEDMRRRSLQKGLCYAGTKNEDGLIIATFTSPDRLEARWFFVVPESPGAGKPWFRIIAIDPEFTLFTPLPFDRWPVAEENHSAAADLQGIVRRICRPDTKTESAKEGNP